MEDRPENRVTVQILKSKNYIFDIKHTILTFVGWSSTDGSRSQDQFPAIITRHIELRENTPRSGRYYHWRHDFFMASHQYQDYCQKYTLK